MSEYMVLTDVLSTPLAAEFEVVRDSQCSVSAGSCPYQFPEEDVGIVISDAGITSLESDEFTRLVALAATEYAVLLVVLVPVTSSSAKVLGVTVVEPLDGAAVEGNVTEEIDELVAGALVSLDVTVPDPKAVPTLRAGVGAAAAVTVATTGTEAANAGAAVKLNNPPIAAKTAR